ncbi:MAG: permease-like cell division protein FtsX [Bacillota bacterium]|nr:permease-like cell division protein FtsX [Bacillota bacterium]
MKINTYKLFISDAIKSIGRNKTISIAAAATVTATIFILGAFLLLFMNVKQGVSEVESNIEIKVYLKEDIKIDQQNAIYNKLSSVQGVSSIGYESKQQALDNLKKQLGDQGEQLVAGMEEKNPMPDSYVVKLQQPEAAEKVASAVKSMDGVDSVKDGREVINKIVAVTNTIKWVGAVIFAILIGVSLFLIGNTIRLTVYSRRREIGIMKFIGATDWFIRWPFIMEGMIIGLAGALVAVAALFYGYRYAYFKITKEFMLAQMISPGYVLTTISWEFVAAGIFIGAVGSIIAIRKFLRV